MRRRLVVLTLVLGGALGGCGSSSSAPSASSSAAPPVSSASSSRGPALSLPTGLDRPCPVGARQLTLRGRDGVRVAAYAIGSGRTAVVLEHAAGAQVRGACNGWTAATWLAGTQHVQVVLFDRCGYGDTTCPRPAGTGARQIAAVTQPAVDYARRHGATRVTLVGASSGAADAIQAAGGVRGVDAVVALSPDVTDTGGPVRAADDRLPTLISYAPGDGLCPPGREQRWFRAVAGHPKRLAVADEARLHGWDLMFDTDGDPRPFADVVAGWVHGRYR
jgi:hypothetical protein